MSLLALPGVSRKPCKSCGYWFTLAYPPLIGKARSCLKCGAISIGDNTVTLGANSVTLGDAAGDPGAVGILQRNAANLRFHDGTNVITLVDGEAIITLFVDGVQTVGAKKKNYNFYAPWAGVIREAILRVDTAPTGAALICDINIGGTTIWTTQANRVQIAAAALSGTQTTFDVTAIAKGNIITFDVDQIGSGVAGSDLLIMLRVSFDRVT